MEITPVYSPINTVVSTQYNTGNIAATAFALSMVYDSANIQPPHQMFQELEDPPEALHLPWGVWLHRRDPLHSIHQKYDTAHLLRTARVAEDILHYAHYAPVIEWPDHENIHESSHEHAAISYISKFEYVPFDDHKVYGMGLEVKKEFKAASSAKISSAAKKALEERNISTESKEIKNTKELDEMPTINSAVKPKSNNLNSHTSNKPDSNNPQLEVRIIKIIIGQIVNLKLFKGGN